MYMEALAPAVSSIASPGGGVIIEAWSGWLAIAVDGRQPMDTWGGIPIKARGGTLPLAMDVH